METTTIVYKKKIKAPLEKVFEAWSKPEIMELWFYPYETWSARSENTLKQGGSYEHDMIDPEGRKVFHKGEYKEVTPPTKLVFTWNSAMVQDTLVTVEFKEVEGTTELTLTHDLFPVHLLKEEGRHKGWEGCLENLISYFEVDGISPNS